MTTPRMIRRLFDTLSSNRKRISNLEQRLTESQQQLETYRHAFETTSVDRDRIANLLAEYKLAPDEPPLNVLSNAELEDAKLYGRVWSAPADELRMIAKDGELIQESFEQILAAGWFSQLTMIQNRAVIERVVDWQVKELNRLGTNLSDLPMVMQESALVSDIQIVELAGRKLSPDFLRLLSYVELIKSRMSTPPKRPAFLEIGSGYGGFARLLKLAFPDAQITLIDIPESLNVAKFFLSAEFSDARFARYGIESAQEIEASDFVLVDAGRSANLSGREFDLAINIWSFGEMPNDVVDAYFKLLQTDNAVRSVFTVNHVFSPVDIASPSLADVLNTGSWLPKFDSQWRIDYFRINPCLDRCPLLRHSHNGVGLFAERIVDQTEMADLQRKAALESTLIREEDWLLNSAVGDETAAGHAGDTRMAIMCRKNTEISDETLFDARRLGTTFTHWRHDGRDEKDSPLFCLWNDVRLNQSDLSRRLLRLWLHGSWRPPLRNTETGALVNAIVTEEFQFGLNADGSWNDDPCLVLPDWAQRRLAAVADLLQSPS